jgi:hypothetical protein
MKTGLKPAKKVSSLFQGRHAYVTFLSLKFPGQLVKAMLNESGSKPDAFNQVTPAGGCKLILWTHEKKISPV